MKVKNERKRREDEAHKKVIVPLRRDTILSFFPFVVGLVRDRYRLSLFPSHSLESVDHTSSLPILSCILTHDGDIALEEVALSAVESVEAIEATVGGDDLARTEATGYHTRTESAIDSDIDTRTTRFLHP